MAQAQHTASISKATYYLVISSSAAAQAQPTAACAEDPQLRLENSSRTHVLHPFVGMRTFPEGVYGIHEVMRFTLNQCNAPLWPSDPPMWSDLPKTPKRQDTLRRSELVKKMVLLLKFWLA